MHIKASGWSGIWNGWKEETDQSHYVILGGLAVQSASWCMQHAVCTARCHVAEKRAVWRVKSVAGAGAGAGAGSQEEMARVISNQLSKPHADAPPLFIAH